MTAKRLFHSSLALSLVRPSLIRGRGQLRLRVVAATKTDGRIVRDASVRAVVAAALKGDVVRLHGAAAHVASVAAAGLGPLLHVASQVQHPSSVGTRIERRYWDGGEAVEVCAAAGRSMIHVVTELFVGIPKRIIRLPCVATRGVPIAAGRRAGYAVGVFAQRFPE